MRIRSLLSLFAVMAITVPCSRAWADDAKSPAVDPAIQAAVAALAEADSDAGRGQALDQLKALDEPPYHRLVREVVRYSSQATDVGRAMTGGVILRELRLSDRNLVEAVMPLLDSTTPHDVKAARSMLEGVEDRSATRRPDFSTYREILNERIRQNEELPASFILYMYEAHPGEALLAMMRAHQLREPAELKEILWAEHAVSDTLWKQQHGFRAATDVEPEAADQLSKLAGHPQWWARMYVVEIMRQHESFRDHNLIEKLRTDPNNLVREAAAQAP